MKKVLLGLALVAAAAVAVPVYAACTGPVNVTGDVGTQSHTRYLSAIYPHPTEPYSIRVAWSVAGAQQDAKTISFGANSGVTLLFGTACKINNTDCATSDGWHSTGNSDRIWSFETEGFYEDEDSPLVVIPMSAWYVNGVKILEIHGAGSLGMQNGPYTQWNEGGMTKIWTGVGSNGMRRMYFDGFTSTGTLFEVSTGWSNNSCLGR